MKFNLKNLFGAVGVVSVALALGGCGSTMHSPEKIKTLFEVGEQIHYFNVVGVNKNLPEKMLCNKVPSPLSSDEAYADTVQRFCGKEQNY